MPDKYIADKTFKASKKIQKGDYENCRFINCTLPESDLSGISFIECEFTNCDLSSSKLFDTSFKTVSFIQSKLIGLRFEDCNEFLFSVNFRECNLNLSSFYQLKPTRITFRNCNLKEVDFTEAELEEALFERCDLDSAIFKNTNLGKTDFRTSYNFLIDPGSNNIQKAKFSLHEVPGLLYKYDIKIE